MVLGFLGFELGREIYIKKRERERDGQKQIKRSCSDKKGAGEDKSKKPQFLTTSDTGSTYIKHTHMF